MYIYSRLGAKIILHSSLYASLPPSLPSLLTHSLTHSPLHRRLQLFGESVSGAAGEVPHLLPVLPTSMPSGRAPLLAKSHSWSGEEASMTALTLDVSPLRYSSPPGSRVHRDRHRDGSRSCPKPETGTRIYQGKLAENRVRVTPIARRDDRSRRRPDKSINSQDDSQTHSSTRCRLPGFKPPSPVAASTQQLLRLEYKKNIEDRSQFWQKFRVDKPHSTSHDVLALTYKARRDWNKKHNVDACLTCLTKGEYEVSHLYSVFNPCLTELLFFGSGVLEMVQRPIARTFSCHQEL